MCTAPASSTTMQMPVTPESKQRSWSHHVIEEWNGRTDCSQLLRLHGGRDVVIDGCVKYGETRTEQHVPMTAAMGRKAPTTRRQTTLASYCTCELTSFHVSQVMFIQSRLQRLRCIMLSHVDMFSSAVIGWLYMAGRICGNAPHSVCGRWRRRMTLVITVDYLTVFTRRKCIQLFLWSESCANVASSALNGALVYRLIFP